MNLREMSQNPMEFFRELVIPSAHGPRKFSEVMAPFQIERFQQIVPALVAVAKGEKPPIGRYFWEATKGASKDSDLACCILWLLAFSPRPTMTIQCGADDKEQAAELKEAADEILTHNEWLGSRITIQNWVIKCNGTKRRCNIIASDHLGAHGSRPTVSVINELTHLSNEQFAQTMADNSSKMPSGLLIVATNSGSRESWQFRWREIARTSDRWIFNKRSEPAPWIDAAELEDARKRSTQSRFNRLWKGIWASGNDGQGLDPDDIEAAVRRKGPCLGDEIELFPFIGSLDIGVRQDHAALVIIGCQPRKPSVVVADVRSWDPKRFGGRVPLSRVKQACIDAQDQFGLLGIAYDPFQAEFLAEELATLGMHMYHSPWTAKSKQEMAQTMIETFSQRRIELYEEPALLRDLSRLVIGERAGRLTIDGPRDEHGHCDRGLALAMGLPWAFATKRQVIQREISLGRSVSEFTEVFSSLTREDV